ncbi:MAG: protein-glutamate O-methyltransferase CheR [Phycisphaerales bacterium]
MLETRLARRLTELGLDTFDQYVMYLQVSPDRQEELEEMLSRVTVGQTSFFRDPAQLAFVAGELLPALIESRRSEKSLRIWSAACATGEEAYTLAILIHRALGERLPDWHVEVLGTDVSAKSIATAVEGRYTDDAVRSVEPAIRDRYFTRDGPYWRLSADIASMVAFDRHNLKDRLGAKRYGHWDAVVCRNAMIYFDQAMRANVASMFADQLRPDGWLMVGVSESLDGLGASLSPHGPSAAHAYRRAPLTAAPAPSPNTTSPAQAPTLRIA